MQLISAIASIIQQREGHAIESCKPTSRPIDSIKAAANVFSLPVLEHSFLLMRPRYPALALLVQNCTASLNTERTDNSECGWITLNLPVEAVSQIIAALSKIAEEAAANPGEPREDCIAIHRTLLDWLIYAQSFLDEMDLESPQQSGSAY